MPLSVFVRPANLTLASCAPSAAVVASSSSWRTLAWTWAKLGAALAETGAITPATIARAITMRRGKDMGARLTSLTPLSQPHCRQKACEFRPNYAPRASNCRGGVNPLSARTLRADRVPSLISAEGSRKKATTHVLHAIVAIVHLLQSMIMDINVKAATDRFLERIIGA